MPQPIIVTRLLIATLLAVSGLHNLATANAATANVETVNKNASVNWPNFGGDENANHYSPLNQINRDNVEQLRVAWQHNS